MSKIKTIAVGLGVVAGFGVSMLPLTAYADVGDYPQVSKELPINLIVNDVIGMTIRSYSGGETDPNGTTSCFTDEEAAAGYTCTTEGDQEVRTTILPGQVDNTSMYSIISVSTNSTTGYTLKLIDADEITSLTTSAGDTITAIASEPAVNNPGWAVRTTDSTATSTGWQAMPNNSDAEETIAAGTPLTIANYTPSPKTVVDERESTVYYGVATTTDQANGIYTDTVVYTATVK